MTLPICINGRFATQPITGVQRFAIEISARMERLRPRTWPEMSLVVPRSAAVPEPLGAMKSRAVGRRSGQLWEQMELPWHVHGVLLNLCNTAPLLVRRQIVVIHDAGVFAVPEAYSAPFVRWYKLLHRALAKTPAKIVTVSRFSRSELVRWLGVREDHIDIVSEGGDHILRQDADGSILCRHGLQPGRYVLAVGSLAPHKNLRRLEATALMLRARGWHLAIAGRVGLRVFSGTGRTPLEAAVYVGGVNDQELRALFEGAACFAFPSIYEGFGLPPLEAMACGCPVVAGPAAAVAEVCGDAAVYCGGDDGDAFARAVAGVLDAPELTRAMAMGGRERAQRFNWENAVTEMLGCLERVYEKSGAHVTSELTSRSEASCP